MSDERQLHEAIARCVAIMVFYKNGERTPDSPARMAAEIRAVAGQVTGMGWPEGEAEWRVVRPVERELMARYGHELGPRIVADFVNAYVTVTAP